MTVTRADWLPDVLRGVGCAVVTYPGWLGRGEPFADLRAVVWHHDASPPGDSAGVPRYMLGEAAAGRPWAQLWVDRLGVWHVLASGVAGHTGRVLAGMPSNRYALGVETDHTTDEPWPLLQLLSLRNGTAAILARLRRGQDALHFHATICTPPGRKTDPAGLDLATERAKVARRLARTADLTTPPQPAPPAVPQEDHMARLIRVLDTAPTFGFDGVRRWHIPTTPAQRELAATGVYGDGKVHLVSRATMDSIPLL